MDVAVAAWVGSTNAGDELIFRELVRILRGGGHSVIVPSINPTKTASDHEVEAVPIGAAGYRALASAEAVVFGGGGLVQDETSIWNLPRHLSRTWVAGHRGRPLVAVGLGVGALRGRSGQRLAARSLRRANRLVVRDRGSQDLLDELGVSSQLGADLVYLADPVDAVREDVTGVILRGPQSGRLLPAAARTATPSEPWLGAVATGLDELSRASGRSTRFVALQPDRDNLIHRMVADRMRTPAELEAPAWNETPHSVGVCAVVVTMRYHGAILASLSGRPSVCIGYSPKLAEIAADLSTAATLIENHPSALSRLAAAAAEVDTGLLSSATEDLTRRARVNQTALEETLNVS